MAREKKLDINEEANIKDAVGDLKHLVRNSLVPVVYTKNLQRYIAEKGSFPSEEEQARIFEASWTQTGNAVSSNTKYKHTTSNPFNSASRQRYNLLHGMYTRAKQEAGYDIDTRLDVSEYTKLLESVMNDYLQEAVDYTDLLNALDVSENEYKAAVQVNPATMFSRKNTLGEENRVKNALKYLVKTRPEDLDLYKTRLAALEPTASPANAVPAAAPANNPRPNPAASPAPNPAPAPRPAPAPTPPPPVTDTPPATATPPVVPVVEPEGETLPDPARTDDSIPSPAFTFPDNGTPDFNNPESIPGTLKTGEVKDIGRSITDSFSGLPFPNMEEIQGQGAAEDEIETQRQENEANQRQQQINSYVDSMTDDGSALTEDQIAEQIRSLNPEATDEEVAAMTKTAIKHQQKQQRERAKAARKAARNEAGEIYGSAVKGIWPTYFDQEIDLPTAGFLTLDSLSKKLKSVGNSIGNIGRAWSGGSMLPDNNEESLWEKRRNKIWENAIETETGKQPGSYLNQYWRKRDSEADISESEAIMKKVDARYHEELKKLNVDYESNRNRIQEIEAMVRAGTANAAVQRELEDLKAIQYANEATAIKNLYLEKGIRNEQESQRLLNESQAIKNSIDHITAMNEEERQRLGLDTQIASLEGLVIANAIKQVERMVAEGTQEDQIARYLAESVPAYYQEAITQPLVEFYRNHPGLIKTAEGYRGAMGVIKDVVGVGKDVADAVGSFLK